MKVILLKDTKDGKAQEIVEVADGYAKNYLIRNKLALPVNHATKHAFEQKMKQQQEAKAKEVEKAILIKQKIESEPLNFELKVTNDIVHGSITKKQILTKLREKGMKVSNYAINATHINTLGISKLKVKILDEIEAILIIKVGANGE